MIIETDKVIGWLNANGHPTAASTGEKERAHLAAEGYIAQRCDVPEVGPADLQLAVCLLTARYLSRRSSPDGFVGMGDLGPARIGSTDRDVDRLIAPWRKVVLA